MNRRTCLSYQASILKDRVNKKKYPLQNGLNLIEIKAYVKINTTSDSQFPTSNQNYEIMMKTKDRKKRNLGRYSEH